MFFAKIHLASYPIFMYALLIVDSQSIPFSSEVCLEQALTVHAFLTQGVCPYEDLQAGKGPTRCSVLCKGTYTTKLQDPVNNCVGYNISFKLNKMLTTKLADFRCKISNCILEVIVFECTFNKNYTGIPFNNASSSKEDQINQQDANGRNGSSSIKDDQEYQQDVEVENTSCIDPSTSVVISLSCLVGGSLIGIGGLLLVKRLRTYKQKLQLPPVFYQPNYGDGGDLPGERTVTIGSPLETEYADIEETIRMVAKAIQVPSYKEDSSSDSRSRENIYHHLSLTEDSTKKDSIATIPTDSIRDSFTDDVIVSHKGSPSFKSVVICTDSSSSKSNGNSKVSPTGSAGSDKYYALEKEYLIFNSSDGNCNT